jgi:hypothetical protein
MFKFFLQHADIIELNKNQEYFHNPIKSVSYVFSM